MVKVGTKLYRKFIVHANQNQTIQVDQKKTDVLCDDAKNPRKRKVAHGLEENYDYDPQKLLAEVLSNDR